VKTNTIDNRIAKTLAYLSSPEGREAWAANEASGYGYRACLIASVMEATGLKEIEDIQVIERGVVAAWVRGNGRVA
jgi:hypothetical protein